MEESISFEDLGLDAITLDAVAAKGFTDPSPIQVLAIPRLLNGDANVIARARTGTGKTAAFGLPLVQTIREDRGHPVALILTPTRELALQVCKEIESLSSGRFPRMAAVYGGQSMGEQLRKLRSGVEIVVGTPGRVKDHLDRGSLKLDNIEYFILDEADEMLDMGFIEDIELIFSKASTTSRVLLFSATMPPAILKIASKFMGEYEIVEEEERPEEPILTEQRYWIVREHEKVDALVRLIDISPDFYGLIFTQTKVDADTVAKELDERGYEAAALHGDIPQLQREKILGRFRKKKTRILVATDVAARGIDIEGLSHVVNFAMPFDGPTYVHRIGRTGRAGAKGLAFTLVKPEERRRVDYLRGVAKGNLKEGTIPTVEAVLSAKRQRLFNETMKSLGFFGTEAEDTAAEASGSQLDTAQASADTENSFAVLPENGIIPTETVAVEAKPAPVDSAFLSFAQELCSDRNPVEVLAAVLQKQFGDELNPERYGTVQQFSSAESNKKQLRLYVGLGRRDGFGRPEIARFFSDLLRIPGRLVDRIEITESFSLVSLPPDAAMTALEMGKQNRSLPHMHLDAKAGKEGGGRDSGRGFGGKSFGGNRRFSGERSRSDAPRDFGREASRDGGREPRRESRDGKSVREARPAARDKGFAKPRTSNAGLYKKGGADRKKDSSTLY